MASTSTEKDDSKAMPPPPLPESVRPPDTKYLQAEFAALTLCLKDAIVKTGEIYSFYADARRLGIAHHVSHPPRSLTDDLGRDIERYDQICDSIEAQLVRAIKVLKRDLRREEQRKEEEERRKNAEAMMLPPPVPPPPIDTTSESSVAQGASNGDSASTRSSPIVGTLPGRRPSAISISSLHRPQFPLKLDLSSTALRITEEEASLYQKGPTSPVTLAPKSARPVGPHDLPPDFLMAFGNNPLPNDVGHGPPTIDLTLPDDMHLAPDQTGMSLGVGIGDSSEKPIELDLDSMDIEMAGMTDLFGDPTDSGDANDGHDGLFSPALGQGSGENPQATVGGDTIIPKVEENTLVDFQMDSNVNDGLFSDFTATAELGPELDAAGAASGTSDMSTANGGEAFDINSLDLSSLDPGFFGDAPDTEMNFSMDEMDAFLDMGSSTEEKKDETMGDPTGSQS